MFNMFLTEIFKKEMNIFRKFNVYHKKLRTKEGSFPGFRPRFSFCIVYYSVKCCETLSDGVSLHCVVCCCAVKVVRLLVRDTR